MANDFEILAGFLAKFSDEVEGRELQELPKDVQVKLRSLAQGSLPETERSRLFDILKENPAWIGRLADEVKALRPGTNQ
jgi:hypothetical protein